MYVGIWFGGDLQVTIGHCLQWGVALDLNVLVATWSLLRFIAHGAGEHHCT